jgi:MerR family transcriptional regulator/heat shock protein HspR
MTAELGLNLAGVERVLELEGQLQAAAKRLEDLERRSQQIREEMEREIEAVRRSFRAEIVPYQPPGQALIPAKQAQPPRRIRVERDDRGPER